MKKVKSDGWRWSVGVVGFATGGSRLYSVSGVAAGASKINSWAKDGRPIDQVNCLAIEDKLKYRSVKICFDTQPMGGDCLPSSLLQVGGQRLFRSLGVSVSNKRGKYWYNAFRLWLDFRGMTAQLSGHDTYEFQTA